MSSASKSPYVAPLIGLFGLNVRPNSNRTEWALAARPNCAPIALSTLTAIWMLFTALSISDPRACADGSPTSPVVGVAPQYDDTHVYATHGRLTELVTSFAATFGGTAMRQATLDITPTPSKTLWRAASSPEGMISAFDFETPVPYPFGQERTGYLVTDMDEAVAAARADGADIVVAPFNDAIGRDAIIQWPGGVYMQLYWHPSAPHAAPLMTVPENRVYISPNRADEFIADFTKFSQGTVVSDDVSAPGLEIGCPAETYRRVRIDCVFGKVVVFVTDGHLPYPFGYDTTGYEVSNLDETLEKAKDVGVIVLVAPYTSGGRKSAVVEFPGGYIAEIHSGID